ncbi:MAG: hypothetical protein WA419_16865 [Silvibacterium sp.]
MMKPVLLLRIASVLTFIHAALHTFGGVFGKVTPGPATVAVQAMRLNQFLVMGHTRSYWDFYRGLGLAVTILLTAEAVVFWQLSSLAKTDSRRLRPILAVFVTAYLVFAVNSYAYFFPGPVIVETLIAILLGLAIVTASSTAVAEVTTA